jgi:hypothetical protein
MRYILVVVLSVITVILSLVVSTQYQIIKDQRIYIEAGCNGRYQGR